jgi:hypothetical protein
MLHIRWERINISSILLQEEEHVSFLMFKK